KCGHFLSQDLPILREHIRLARKPRDDTAVCRLHVDVWAVVDDGALGVDTEERRTAHREGAAGDEEQEHALTVPTGAAYTLPGFERDECSTEIRARHQRISCFDLHSILFSIFSIFGSADLTDSATSISNMMSGPS